jgi:hypothetical protein
VRLVLLALMVASLVVPASALAQVPAVPTVTAPGVPAVPTLPIPELPGFTLPELEPTGDPAADAALDSARAIAAQPSAIQAEVNAAISRQQSLGLQRALGLAAKVGAPTCAVLGQLAAATGGGLGVGTSLVPLITLPNGQTLSKIDANTNKTLMTYYKQAITAGSADLPPALAPLAPQTATAKALLTLLELNWHTSYVPTPGATPLVFDTPAYLNLPILLDVDDRLGFDQCAVMSLDLGTGQITEQISKLPTAAKTLPVDVAGQYLGGVISSGYESTETGAPADFKTMLPLSPNNVETTLKAPTDAFTQVYSLTSALQYRWASTKPANGYIFRSSTPTGGSGTQIDYSGASRADRFAYSVKLSTLKLGLAATPAPIRYHYCYSTKGSCSTAPAAQAATEKVSLDMWSSQPVKFDQTSGGTPAAGSECPSTPALLGNEVHLTTNRFSFAADPTTAKGHAWVDNAPLTVPGCIAVSPAITGPVGKLPAGFAGDHRLATWATPSGSSTPRTTGKSGTVTCPAGTSIANPLGTSPLTKYVCPFPPQNTAAPAVSGQPYVGADLATGNGTWTPAASDANAPAFTYAWQRCDADGEQCATVPGTTAATRTVTAADDGHRLRAVVTATNADGTATQRSAATDVITFPPPPANTAAPKITGVPGVGQTLTATNGTWANVPTAYARQWQRCDEDGHDCADIAGATGQTYAVAAEDLGHALVVVVTASNAGGSGSASSAAVLIPPPPVNQTLPAVTNAGADAGGRAVLAGDRLKAVTGGWSHAADFAYAWQRCDAAGEACAPIAGATDVTYVADTADIGSTLRVTVTASNPNGSADATSAATGAVISNDLAARSGAPVVDGTVLASAPSDHGTSYLGGAFDTVGPFAGGAGAIATDGSVSHAAAAIGGPVRAIAGDGSGGYYLGGSFTQVLGHDCASLAHVRGDGTLDAAFCDTGLTGEVRALDVAHDLIAVGGAFALGDHHNLAFLSRAAEPSFVAEGDPNGAVNAIVDNSANTLTTSGTNPPSLQNRDFFVGGDFTAIGEQPRKRLVEVTLATGSPTTLNIGQWTGGVACATTPPAGSTCGGEAASVRTIEYVRGQTGSGSTVSPVMAILVGGRFDTASAGAGGGTTSTKLNAAAFGATNAASGAPSNSIGTWNPAPNGTVESIVAPPVQVATGAATPVYLAGSFTSLGVGANAVPNQGAGAFGFNPFNLVFGRDGSSAKGATATSSPNTLWTPAVSGGRVKTLAADAATVYAGGTFTGIAGSARHRIATLGPAGAAAPAAGALDPNAGAEVRALGLEGPSLLAGGSFQVLGGRTRVNVAEIGPGGVTGWNPGADGTLRAVATSGGTVYLGGSFGQAGGAARANLAAIGGDGAATGWNPGADGTVRALASAGGVLYAGGDFTHAGGAARSHLAALDGSGAATSWDPGADGTVNALATAGDTVYAGGAFGTLGGAARANLGAVDASGAATGWDPGASGEVRALATAGPTIYAGGVFGLAALDGSGAATGWDAGIDGAVNAVAVVGSTVYAGGAFAHAGGEARQNVAGLDANGATARAFAPAPDAPVSTISLTSSGSLAIGGAFTRTTSGPSPGLAFFGG